MDINRSDNMAGAKKTTIRVYSLILFGPVLLSLAPVCYAQNGQDSTREYKIKAAFLYNFIQFVDWPKEKEEPDDHNEPITIGILGRDPFQDAFESLKDKSIKGRMVVTKRFKSHTELTESDRNDDNRIHPDIEAIRKCHLLFVCASEKEYVGNIINSIKAHSVLTVADMEGFLQAGGIINLTMEKNKFYFEINVANAKRANLEMRSKLLRLARKVVDRDPIE